MFTKAKSGLERLLLLYRNLRPLSTSNSDRHPVFNIEIDRKERSITLIPKQGTEHKSSLIWLHGLGDSANGFADVFLNEEFAWSPPTCKVLLLTAPERPVTLNGGMIMNSWYDIYSLRGDDDMLSLDKLYDKYNREEMLQSVAYVSSIIDMEVASLGDSKKVFVGGFSQGCALSLATMIHYPKRLGGLFCLSGMNAIKIDWSKVP
jgi:phospholipase/carboxylesterase